VLSIAKTVTPEAWVLPIFWLVGLAVSYAVLALNRVEGELDQRLLIAVVFGVPLGSLWWRFALPQVAAELAFDRAHDPLPTGVGWVPFVAARLLLGLGVCLAAGVALGALTALLSWPVRKFTGMVARRSLIVSGEILTSCPVVFLIVTVFGSLAGMPMGN
jgi:hypothetical protein